MSLKNIAYYVDIIKEGSFSRAAFKNKITQPALSSVISRLEKEFEATLVVRSRQGAVPTAAGRILFEKGQSLLRNYASIYDEIQDLASEPHNHFHIVAGGTASLYLLPGLLRNYRAIFPHVSFSLTEGDASEINAALNTDNCDLAIVSLPEPALDERLYHIREIYEDELVVISPSGMFNKRQLTFKDLQDSGFIHFNKASAIRKTLEEAFARNTIRVNTVMELRSIELICRMVEDGVGIGVVSALAASTQKKIDSHRIKGLQLKRRLGLVYRKDRYLPRSLQSFIDDLGEIS